MSIDGWDCDELYPQDPWRIRTARKGNVEWYADSDGLRVDEGGYGYLGASGTYGLPANVVMWLVQAVR